MKSKFLAVLFISMLASGPCIASMSPSQIEATVKSGDYSKAQEQAEEALKEHPTSARANYLLGQIFELQNNHKQAYDYLTKASELDRSLSFAGSQDKFRNIMSKVEVNLGKASAPRTTNIPMYKTNSFMYAVLASFGLGLILLLLVKMNKNKKRKHEEIMVHSQDMKLVLSVMDQIDSLRLESAVENLSSYLDVAKGRITSLYLNPLSKSPTSSLSNREREGLSTMMEMLENAKNVKDKVDIITSALSLSGNLKAETKKDSYNPKDWKVAPINSGCTQGYSPVIGSGSGGTTIINNSSNNDGFVEGLVLGSLMSEDRHSEQSYHHNRKDEEEEANAIDEGQGSVDLDNDEEEEKHFDSGSSDFDVGSGSSFDFGGSDSGSDNW